MSLQSFDTLVCGDDLSGLIAANLLSIFNYKVVVLRSSTPADRYQHNGFSLPTSPVILPPLVFGELLSNIRQRLSLSRDELEEDSECVEKFQYITRKLRLDISTDKNETAEEFFCELGIKKENTIKFIHSANSLMEEIIDIFNRHLPYPAFTFWDKRRLKKNDFADFLNRKSALQLIENEQVREAFKSLLKFISYIDSNTTVPSQESIIGFLFLDKWFLFPSIERIKSVFIKRLVERGNLILNGVGNNYTIDKRGFSYYLRDERRHHRFRIDAVIVSSEHKYISNIMPQKRFERLGFKKQGYGLRFTTNFVVGAGCIPEIASKFIVYREENTDKTNSRYFQISISKAIRGKAIIKDAQVISVTTFVNPSELKKENASRLNQIALDVLLKVFPFADEYIIDISSIFDADMLFDSDMNEIKSSDNIFTQYLFTDYSLQDGILLNDMKTGIDNFINSFAVFAPIGIFGDFMAAVRAAEIISKNILGR